MGWSSPAETAPVDRAALAPDWHRSAGLCYNWGSTGVDSPVMWLAEPLGESENGWREGSDGRTRCDPERTFEGSPFAFRRSVP